MADLSIVVVSWNVRELLRRCLLSIAESGSEDLVHEIIVVDNYSADGTVDTVREEFPSIRLIANTNNAGYTRASNQGLAASHGGFVLFLNPDTEVLGHSLAIMVRHLKLHPDLGAVGPQLLYPDGSVQSSRRRFPTLGTALFESTLLELWWPENPWARRYRMADAGHGEQQEVDWVVGACLMVRREALDEVGGFDEGFFMYSEELDLCRRLRNAGWRVGYLPSAQVVHHEGKSSEQVVAARHIYFQTSKVRYFRKHHGRASSELIRCFLLATYAYQAGVEALKGLLGHKKQLRSGRVQAYVQLLRTGLQPRDL